jgi:NADP-dependent alcohol dehydrogenase
MPELFEFVHHNPTAIYFGPHSLNNLPNLVPEGARILLLYGGGSIRENGVYAEVTQALSGHIFVEFGGVEPNPKVETLSHAVELVRQERLDFILAVGGGSVIDGGKYIAAAAHYAGDGWDLVSGKAPAQSALPIGVVLTLAATGSESNLGSSISSTARNEKHTFFSPALYPQFAILNPMVLTSVPDRQLANGLVDAFIHVCEQYLTSSTGALVREGYAEALLRALLQLAVRFDQRNEPDWLQNLMWAANQALCGIVSVGVDRDFVTHEISHELTARYGIDHARALTILHASVLRETVGGKRQKLVQMGKRVFDMPDPTAEAVIERIETLYRELGMPTHLRDTGALVEDSAQSLLSVMLREAAAAPMSPLGSFGEDRMHNVAAATCGA